MEPWSQLSDRPRPYGALDGKSGTLDAAMHQRWVTTDSALSGLDLSGAFTFDAPGPNKDDSLKRRTYFLQTRVFGDQL